MAVLVGSPPARRLLLVNYAARLAGCWVYWVPDNAGGGISPLGVAELALTGNWRLNARSKT